MSTKVIACVAVWGAAVGVYCLLGLLDTLLARWLKRRAERAPKVVLLDDTEFDDPDAR
jgi:hypothetical protein